MCGKSRWGDDQLGVKTTGYQTDGNGCMLAPQALCKHNCLQFDLCQNQYHTQQGNGAVGWWLSAWAHCYGVYMILLTAVRKSQWNGPSISLLSLLPIFLSQLRPFRADWMTALGKSELHSLLSLFTPTTGSDTAHTAIKNVSSTFTHLSSLQPILLLY